jgi:beta-galactosidase
MFEEKGNPIVAPTVYHKKMEDEAIYSMKKAGFDKIYPNMKDFYLEQQKMHGIANKRMIEATRSNSSIAGYCVHALVGGDWVIGAGLLDLWRNPKTLVYDLTKAACQEQIVTIRILPRNIYAEKGAKLEITGISELETEAANISIKIKSEKGKTVFSKTLKKDFGYGISKLFIDELNTEKLKGTYTVNVNVTNKAGKEITSNSQPFDVFVAKQLQAPKTKIAVVDPAKSLTSFLQNRNIEFVPFSTDIDKNTLVLVGKANIKNKAYKKQAEAVKEFVKAGGYAIFLEVPGKPIKRLHIGGELNEVETDALPFGAEMHSPWVALGGWAGKPHIVTDHPVFKGLPTEMIMHGVYENVHPKVSMSKQKGKYIAGMIGYDHFPKMDIMIRHYNGPGETWWAADVLEAQIGEGKMLLSTMDILTHLGQDPVAEKILFNMINFMSNQ